MIVIVGGGIAGLVCARMVLRAGQSVVVLEGSDGVGGRIRTDLTKEGFRLDRGFQVLPAGYPALRRNVSLRSLQPCYFPARVRIVSGGQEFMAGHPLHDPRAGVRVLLDGTIGPKDVLAFTRLCARSLSLGDRPLRAEGISTLELLTSAGVSRKAIERVVSPVFGGISLDRTLQSDAGFFLFVLRMMAVGRVFVPTRGVQALPDALARDFPRSALRLGVIVKKLLVDAGTIRGVETSEGQIEASIVVVATDLPAAAALVENLQVEQGKGCTTVYFAGDRPLLSDGAVTFNAEPSLVNQVVQISQVSPEYAPAGKHLLSATILQDLDGTDVEVGARAWDDLRGWYSPAGRLSPDLIGVVRVGYAQFAQPRAIYDRLPSTTTDISGLYLAGEYLHSSSVQGAMRGGEMAGQAILKSINRAEWSSHSFRGWRGRTSEDFQRTADA